MQIVGGCGLQVGGRCSVGPLLSLCRWKGDAVCRLKVDSVCRWEVDAGGRWMQLGTVKAVA